MGLLGLTNEVGYRFVHGGFIVRLSNVELFRDSLFNLCFECSFRGLEIKFSCLQLSFEMTVSFGNEAVAEGGDVFDRRGRKTAQL